MIKAVTAKKIKWFTTGGTIDGQPYPDPENPPDNVVNDVFSNLPMTLRGIADKVRPDFSIELEQMWSRDSKKINEREIATLAQRIKRDNQHDVFVVAHGTDSMPRNARLLMQYLDADLKKRGKSVIFTGAMLPLSNGGDSDGHQNLQYVIENYDNPAMFTPGVHVVMHGKVFSPVGLCKDFDKMEFFTTSDPKELRAYEKTLKKLSAPLGLRV